MCSECTLEHYWRIVTWDMWLAQTPHNVVMALGAKPETLWITHKADNIYFFGGLVSPLRWRKVNLSRETDGVSPGLDGMALLERT